MLLHALPLLINFAATSSALGYLDVANEIKDLANKLSETTTFKNFALVYYFLKQCPKYEFLSPMTNPTLLRDKYNYPFVPIGRASTVSINSNLKHDFTWDFIVIGAGSSGSTLAGRLSEEGNYSVLLLEAGKAESLLTDVPLFAPLFHGTSYDWGYKAEPQEGRYMGFNNGRAVWARGKGIGGSSITNYMIYTRGHKLDWDEIAAQGNPGWSWNDVLPYFLKMERANLGNVSANSPLHNITGPLSIEYPNYRSSLAEAFMEAAHELGVATEDYNDGDPRGFSYVQAHTLKGHRNSAARAYLFPFIKSRRNLDIFYDCHVTKINIENKVAKSVSYARGNKRYVAHARKEIILSAGAVNSPQILMLSGIGPADHLRDLNIDLIQNASVGENMYDHVFFPTLAFLVNTSTPDNSIKHVSKSFIEWLTFGTGPLTAIGSVEGLAYLKTSQVTSQVPNVELMFAANKVMPIAFTALNIDDALVEEMFGAVMGRDVWSLIPTLMKPKSKGFIKLASKDPFAPPLIHYDYFADGRDLEAMVEAIKYAVAVSKTRAFQKHASRLHDRPVPMCKRHAFGGDEYWRCALKALGTSTWHPVATCKMGPASDPEAVVGSDLRVRGVEKLRVCDAGVIPLPLCGHMNAPAVMIGEKCADLVKTSNPI